MEGVSSDGQHCELAVTISFGSTLLANLNIIKKLYNRQFSETERFVFSMNRNSVCLPIILIVMRFLRNSRC